MSNKFKIIKMEQIKLRQTSSTGSVVCGFVDGLASTSAAINERLIADKVLRVQRGHYKGV